MAGSEPINSGLMMVFFSSGEISACFQALGKRPDEREKFTIDVSWVRRVGRIFFNRLVGRGSRQHDVDGEERMMRLTASVGRASKQLRRSVCLERKHSSHSSGGPTYGSEAAATSRSILEMATLSRKNSAKSVASSLGFECLGRALMSDLPDSELTIL